MKWLSRRTPEGSVGAPVQDEMAVRLVAKDGRRRPTGASREGMEETIAGSPTSFSDRYGAEGFSLL
jgi:hypothetical protein